MRVGDTVLDAAAESGIDKNWCLLDNQSTWNTLINGEYLSTIIDTPDRKYPRVHFNVGVNHINKIVELPGYSNPVWYNPKGISKIL